MSTTLSSIILLLLALAAVPAQSAPAPGMKPESKRVLILYSLDKDHPGHVLTEQGLREVFKNNSKFISPGLHKDVA